MPGYRFVSLLVYYLKEDKTDESLEKINDLLADADLIRHPFVTSTFGKGLAAGISSMAPSKSSGSTEAPTPPPSYESIEEKKRREAAEAGKPFRVPEWWRGERANYKIAKTMMVSLPKKIGPIDK